MAVKKMKGMKRAATCDGDDDDENKNKDIVVPSLPDNLDVSEDSDEVSDSDESYYSGLEEEGSSDEDDDIDDFHSDDNGDEDQATDVDDDGDGDDNSDNEYINSEDNDVDSAKAAEKKKESANSNNIKEITSAITEGISSKTSANTNAEQHTGLTDSDTDSDDDDDMHSRNPVGRVPLWWYNEFPHIGYTQQGDKIAKPATGDQLDEFLEKMENPDYYRTIKDADTNEDTVITDAELDILQRIQQHDYPDASYDPYAPWVDFFSNEKSIHPVTNAPEPKRRFIPSKWEHKRIMKLVRAIRKGYITPGKKAVEKPQYFMLWNDDSDKPLNRDNPMFIPAPKPALPGHDESYNPPPEYLPTAEETEEWNNQQSDERTRNFLPQKFSSLRQVPGYTSFIRERFERCLDLYLCPRMKKNRPRVDPESLLPKLPRPSELRPFPTTESIRYEGHIGRVRKLSVSPSGQWLATAGDDKTVRFFEVTSGRCMRTIHVSGQVSGLAWNPSPSVCLIAVAVDRELLIINAQLGSRELWETTDVSMTDSARSAASDAQSVDSSDNKGPIWMAIGSSKPDYSKLGLRIVIEHEKTIKSLSWHHKGDYLATVSGTTSITHVHVHQLSRHKSQTPFKKNKGLVQCVEFHPSKPFFFVATQRYVRIYNLAQQTLMKKLMTGVKWVSSIAVHPQGDNVIIGSYDRRVAWFDLDLSVRPYKSLRYHKFAVRNVAFHPTAPLFASCADDGLVHVFHGKVFQDLLQNPLIVPVKILKGHSIVDQLGVLDCAFHPRQPWLFSAGADATVRLWT